MEEYAQIPAEAKKRRTLIVVGVILLGLWVLARPDLFRASVAGLVIVAWKYWQVRGSLAVAESKSQEQEEMIGLRIRREERSSWF